MDFLKSFLYPFRRWLIGGVVILISLGVFLHIRGCDKRRDAVNDSLVLKPNELAAVIVDPSKHQITLVTADKTKSFTLPVRPSRIAILKDDTIQIASPQYGSEFAPFLGAAYTLDGGVVLGGLDVFYWKRLDMALGLAIDPHLIQHTQAFIGFSYMAYSNCAVGLGLGNKVTPMVFIKVRL